MMAFDPVALDPLRIALRSEGDAAVRHVLTLFAEEAPSRLRAVERLHAADELPRMRRVAHQLCGSCAVIGALPLSALCRELERAERAGDRIVLIERIGRELDVVLGAVRDHIAARAA